ncbi:MULTISPECIES: gas vesicle protein GvpO [Streptomyces]|uniref:Gas vesicle protein n=1 Tax=Streptomyces eurythermus TaxID=42237 RepID=A0ABW6Z555_9ACTN|nr:MULTISPECIES: gas vesicle protein [Streptomyces]QIS74084.1 gas vesicle protein [Streptomyces sp. DSM 40868]WDM13195.1 gas vesicle protein [Streptomyces lavenduligriseus]
MSNTNSTPNTQSSRKSQNSHDTNDTHDTNDSHDSVRNERNQNDADGRRPTPMEVLRQARAQLTELTGLVPETVSSFEQTEDGWSVEVEVLELARVPDTMSLMASYQVELDPEGQLTGYRRVRRYERGRADARGGR